MKSRNVKRLERGGQHSSSSSSSDGHDPYQSRSSSRSDKFCMCFYANGCVVSTLDLRLTI